jgi:acetyltransferase-like isoleucine patch superfamily enzyme
MQYAARARGPAIMLRTIDEPCVEDQVATEKTTLNQRLHHGAPGATDGSARFNKQALIRIGSNGCISQDAFLTTGSHDLKSNMDSRIAPVVIEHGVWTTSKCVA